MKFKKIKPREILENENQTDYECYLREFYYNLNPPKPMDRYDFSYKKDLLDSEEIMDGKNGEYIKYLERYYNKYYYKLNKKINYALYKSNKKTNRALYKANKNKGKVTLLEKVKSNITSKATEIKNSLQNKKENLINKLKSVKPNFKQLTIQALNISVTVVSAILLVNSISAIMNHSVAFGILGTVVSLAGASIAGTINYNLQKESNKSVEKKKKVKTPLFSKIKKQLKSKTKSLNLFARKQRNKNEEKQNSEMDYELFDFDLEETEKEFEKSNKSDSEMFEFDLDGVEEDKSAQNSRINLEALEFDLDGVEEKLKAKEESTFNFDLSPLNTNDRNIYGYHDLFNFDLNKKEDMEPAKVKVIKR